MERYYTLLKIVFLRKFLNDCMLISVVIPVYGCKNQLKELISRLNSSISEITEDFEVILVNDSSPDRCWPAIMELCKNDQRIKGINLSRNFGQHFAITAGLEYCSGKWIVVMDCDLQDRPEEIVHLYNKTSEGYDIVFAQRTKRNDSFIKVLLSKFFYKTLAYFTDTEQDYSIGNFGIYGEKAIQSVLMMQDRYRFFPTMIKWVGFERTSIPVEHEKRNEGKTTYSFNKLLNLAINTILTFSDKPLRLTVKFGLLLVFLSLCFTVYNLYLYFDGQIIQRGWTSMIISIWFLSGIIIFISGIIGLYVGKIFDNVKNRPLFIVKDKVNFE